jgi:hypothetical protein
MFHCNEGVAMPAHRSPAIGGASAKRVLAAELTRLRSVSGQSLGALSDLTTYDRAYLHKLETGKSSGSPEVLAALDAVYGTGQHLQDLWELARGESHPNPYSRFMERERQAASRHHYASSVVPGLLQTKSYMQELFETGRQPTEKAVSRLVAVRLARQTLLRGKSPQHYRVIVDESVLLRPLKDKDAWQEQLAALSKAAKLPHVHIQVLPLSAGLHALVGASLTLLRLRTGKTIAYREWSHAAQLIEEPNQVEQLHSALDLLRDSALSPTESVQFLKDLQGGSSSCQ